MYCSFYSLFSDRKRPETSIMFEERLQYETDILEHASAPSSQKPYCQHCLFCHLPRCRQSAEDPLRFLPPPCRLTKYSALAVQFLAGWSTRACLKIHSRRLHAPLRGIFGPDSVSVARYASIIGTKSPTKWDAQPTESNFQTRSSILGSQISSFFPVLAE